MNKTCIIIGAGPAGLTLAYELLQKSDIKPIIFEKDNQVGGLAKTIQYKGNRIDLGGHRFFSKSDYVMDLWFKILKLQSYPAKDDLLLGRDFFDHNPQGGNPEIHDDVFLIRNRVSRIFYLNKFFDYPITLNLNTIKNLGLLRLGKIAVSYLLQKLFPIRDEKNLEDFYVNRFGRELYRTFFRDYTKKVWGISSRQLSKEWGAQRVKGLSISKALLHAIKQLFLSRKDIRQKKVETSLIQTFFYPKYGPGQLWEKMAEIVLQKGGEIHLNQKVIRIENSGFRVNSVWLKDVKNGQQREITGDYFVSTMPIKELVNIMKEPPPKYVYQVACSLEYRNLIVVGLLLKKLKIKNRTKVRTLHSLVPDCWIYVQDNSLKLGRIQIFNNWSPYLVTDLSKVWLGLEYFCDEKDELWNWGEQKIAQMAIKEITKAGIAIEEDLLDFTVIKVDKAYTKYSGSYKDFNLVREFMDKFENLYLVGRNGMHRYNNMDHSMLAACECVKNIIENISDRSNIWNVNTEMDYHEIKKN